MAGLIIIARSVGMRQFTGNFHLHWYPNVIFLVMFLSLGPVAVADAEIKATVNDQQALSLTVYNQNLALIRDVRKVKLTKGLNKIAVREGSAKIQPETVSITSLPRPPRPDALSLLEQNFDYDLLTPRQLLQKYVGRQVRVIKTHPATGAEKEVPATVLSANNGVVLKIADRKVDAHTVAWPINVPAAKRSTLSYRVLVRY